MNYPGARAECEGESAFFLSVLAGISRLGGGVFRALSRAVTENLRPSHERSVLILEAADVLGVSRRTVYYRIRDGRLQTIRTRGGSQRVLWSSIEALLRSTQPEVRESDADANSSSVEG
jgi:excisionase family DNA binding protein